MKHTGIFLLLFCGCLVMNGQESRIINHRAGQSILSFSPTVLVNTPNGTQLAGGAKFQLFISQRFSIDADVMFSKDYAHFSPAIIGIPFAFMTFSSDINLLDKDSFILFLISVAAVAVSFEHISYHIPVTTNLDISPYISVLRYKYAYSEVKNIDPDFISDQLSFAGGLQLNRYFGRFVFSPYAEYNIGYKDLLPGFNAGIYFGVYFLGKKQE